MESMMKVIIFIGLEKKVGAISVCCTAVNLTARLLWEKSLSMPKGKGDSVPEWRRAFCPWFG
jgi:hypothetical protein